MIGGALRRFVVFLVKCILILQAFVFFHLGGVELFQTFADRLNKVAAKCRPTFASRCLCGYEQKEIGKNLTTAIVAKDIWLTGRKNSDRTQQKQVGIFGRIDFADNLRKQTWKLFLCEILIQYRPNIGAIIICFC